LIIQYSGVRDDAFIVRPEWQKPFDSGNFSCTQTSICLPSMEGFHCIHNAFVVE